MLSWLSLAVWSFLTDSRWWNKEQPVEFIYPPLSHTLAWKAARQWLMPVWSNSCHKTGIKRVPQDGTREWTWSSVEGCGRLQRGGGFQWRLEPDGPCNPGGGNGAFKGREIWEHIWLRPVCFGATGLEREQMSLWSWRSRWGHTKRHGGRGMGTSRLRKREPESQACMQSVVFIECLLCARLCLSWEQGLQYWVPHCSVLRT